MDDLDIDSDAPRPEEIEEDGVIDIDPETEVMSVAYEIASYGADYPVDGLVKRMNTGDVLVPSFDPKFPEGEEVRGFQRRFVWTRPQMDKFIESLLLGLPVPGVFLVRDRENKLLVLDGQQRLRTLQYFYSGFVGEKKYRLRYTQEPFIDRTYEELEPEDRRRLDDSILHATVLRQEHPAGSQDAVYSIFERLNTGGSPLQPQEIRVALYHGRFLNGISRLNEDAAWRSLYGPMSNRFKDHELILRVLALYETPDDYSRPVKSYLNHYLEANRERSLRPDDGPGLLFSRAMRLIADYIGPGAFRPIRSVNAAVVDSLSVGVMRRLAAGEIRHPELMEVAYRELLKNEAYRDSTTSSTAAEETVEARLREAVDAFSGIE